MRSGRAKSRKRVTSALARFTSLDIYPASSLARGFEFSSFRLSVSADPLITPRGLRISCASPAESCPRAASRLGTPRFGLGPFQLAIGFRQLFGHLLILHGLAPVLQGEAVYHNGRQKEKHDPDGELGRAGWSQRIFLQRGIEIRTVGRRSQSSPEQGAPGDQSGSPRSRSERNKSDSNCC